MNTLLRHRAAPAIAVALIVALATPATAAFHFMQIEQAMGGVDGDASAQAIQLRMRSAGQDLVQFSRVRAWDAAGENPILLLDILLPVSSGQLGDRVLLASASFPTHTDPAASPDFTLASSIPESHLAAGSLTFEEDNGTIYWRLSWGGDGYTGDTNGSIDNDDDGDYGPPAAGALPSLDARALLFQGSAADAGTTNLADYARTAGAAVFTNNAGASFTVQGSTASAGDPGSAGAALALTVGPNPFNARTSFRFTLRAPEAVHLVVTDAAGRLVRAFSATYAEGTHAALWDGRDASGRRVAPGVYFYGMRAGEERRVGRVLRIP